MSTLTVKELSHPAGEVIKIAAGKTLDLKSQGTTTLPTGSVLQVQYMTHNTAVSSTSASFSDTGITVNITPSSTSSKVMILTTIGGCGKAAAGNPYLRLQIVTGGGATHRFEGEGGYNASGGVQSFGACAGQYLDSPNSTSAVNYKIQMSTAGGGTSSFNNSSTYSSITVMEIQG